MKQMLIDLVSGSVFLSGTVLAIFVTIWWRKKFIYITDDIISSWTKTFVGAWVLSIFAVMILSAPLIWVIEVACDYWYVTVALIAFMCYGGNDSSPEGENTDAADDGAGKSGENDDASGGNSDGGKA